MGAETGEPVERAIRLAAYLSERQPVTMRDIVANVPGYEDANAADGLTTEAQRKKVKRDLVMLTTVFGVGADYSPVQDAYSLQPGWLTPRERRAVLAAAALVWVEGIAPSEQADALGASFDGSTQRVVLQVHELMLTLRDACAGRRRIDLGYQGRRRLVDPLGIGLWRQHTYLVGRDVTSGEPRHYRFDRIDRDPSGAWVLTLLDETFDLPEDLDRSAWFDLDPNAWGGDPLVTARLRVDSDHRERVAREFDGCRVVDDDGQGTTLEIDVRHRRSFLDRVLGFGTHVVVTAPDELVQQVREHLQAMIETAR